jgi:hypothetical protein
VTCTERHDFSGLPVAVTMLGGRPKVRRMYGVVGCAPTCGLKVHNNDIPNALRGLYERVYRVPVEGGFASPPRPCSDVWRENLKIIPRSLYKYLPHAAPITQHEFVDRYRGRRKAVYASAVESLARRPVRHTDAFLSTFVKAEKVNPLKAPRLIQPRGPRYNVCVGQYLKDLEGPLCGAIARMWGGKTVMKGLNADGTGVELHKMWSQFDKPAAIGLDASRFDQHVSRIALEWEHSVYLQCFNKEDRRELARLLKWQLDNHGYINCPDGRIKYKVEGCRMSGDMNTGMGNCLIMCCLVYAYCDFRKIHARLANNGDDCTVIMEQKDVDVFNTGLDQWFTEMGFTMKVEDPVYEIEHIEFCQSHPVQVNGTYRMVRKPSTMAKDLITVIPLDVGDAARKYVGAIGDCGSALNSGVPVQQDFYSMLRKFGVRGMTHPTFECGMMNLSRGMVDRYNDPTPETRYSYWMAFGVTPDVQIALEDWYRSHDLLFQFAPREYDDFPPLLPQYF